MFEYSRIGVSRWSMLFANKLPASRLATWIGIGSSKLFDWRRRYGKFNEHDAPTLHDHWLEGRKKQTITGF
jgi:hypothetical protein